MQSINPALNETLTGLSYGVAVYSSTNNDYPRDDQFLDLFIQPKLNALFADVPAAPTNITYLVTNPMSIPNRISTISGTFRFIKLGLIVKPWELGNLPNHRFMLAETGNLGDSPGIFEPPNTINLTNGQIIPYLARNGNPSQGNENPVAEFENHAVYEINSKIFDPSYGTSASDKLTWESNSFEAYGIYMDFEIQANLTNEGMSVMRRVIFVYQNESPSSSGPSGKYRYIKLAIFCGGCVGEILI